MRTCRTKAGKRYSLTDFRRIEIDDDQLIGLASGNKEFAVWRNGQCLRSQAREVDVATCRSDDLIDGGDCAIGGRVAHSFAVLVIAIHFSVEIG